MALRFFIADYLATEIYRRACGVIAIFAVATALAGCSERPEEHEHGSDVRDTVALPIVNKTEAEIRSEMSQFPPFSPEFNQSMLELVIVEDAIRKREGVVGFIKETPIQHEGNQVGVVDKETGKLALRAMTCFNPKCAGQGKGGGPLLFVHKLPHLSVGSDGQMIVGPFPMSEMDENPLVCPVCGEAAYVREYDPPETLVRRKQLMEQLNSARGSRGKGKRTVKEIIIEMANLPKLFLVPED
jgi:hypothetical protein